MEIRPMLPDLFYRQIEEGDLDQIRRSIDAARAPGDGWKHLLRGLRRQAAARRPEAGQPRPLVVIDAVADLIPTFDAPDPGRLIEAAAVYVMDRERSIPRFDLFDDPLDTGSTSVVPVSILEDALAAGDLAATCRVAERLVRVIRTREYFLELILETTAHDPTPDGLLLIQADTAVKSLHEMEWEAGRGIAYRLFEDASAAPLPPAPPVQSTPPPVPCRAAFIASLEDERPEASWLYISHALQAQRYAQMKAKGVRWGLRNWISDRLFHGDAGAMDRAESSSLPRASGGAGEETAGIPVEVGRSIAAAVSSGDASGKSAAEAWAIRVADVEPLYRWLAEGALPALRQGDGRAIVAVNAARWGAHLLDGPMAGRLTARLFDRLETMSSPPRSG